MPPNVATIAPPFAHAPPTATYFPVASPSYSELSFGVNQRPELLPFRRYKCPELNWCVRILMRYSLCVYLCIPDASSITNARCTIIIVQDYERVVQPARARTNTFNYYWRIFSVWK